MVKRKEKKVTWKEWSKKLSDDAKNISEAELNETLKKLKAGEYASLEPSMTGEEVHKYLAEVAEASDKMLKQAEALPLKKKKRIFSEVS
jgi:hypothetical protein